jgi:hypothetical protein
VHPELRAAFERELSAAGAELDAGRLDAAFAHLERAHVLGQRYALPHARAHWGMLRVGWRRRDRRELAGQIVRLIVAAPASALGVLPLGNTGGANVSATRPMPIPPDLQSLLDLDSPQPGV